MSGVASIPVTTTSTFSDSLPSVENVMKWKRKEVLDFLQENKEVLDIEPSDIKIIEDNRVAGLAFLGLTEQKLVNPPYNLLGGPAGAIANLVKRINDKGQEQPGASVSIISPKRKSDYEEEQSKNVKKIRKYPSPSSFAQIGNLNEYQIKDQEFLIYRPSGCASIPLKLYNPAFCNFQKNFENKNLPVDKSYYQWTLNCIKSMADIYSNEKLRQREFHERLRELFREEIKLLQLDDQSSNDGVLECNVHAKSILYLLAEVKNEIGTGKCDPTTQAAISFAKFYTQSKNEQMLKWCNMPCFIIGLAGPWICVLGAVYAEKPLVEPLTDLIPLIPINDRSHLEKIARLFMALRLGCNELKTYYGSLPPPTINEQRFFPYVRRAGDIEFDYKEKLVDDPYKLLWKAEAKDKQMIIVKFTHRYNKEAHNLCYNIGKAPRLFYVSDKQCGLHMIVMEFVEGQILRDCVDLTQSDYEVIINDIEEAVLNLHENNLVFADLRDSNILVTRDNEGYHGILIDFDWVGREDVERYPLFINSDIAWPTGVGDNEPLKKEHDVYWLSWLKKKYLGEGNLVEIE